jgi:DNA-binding transcriptional LysR family regulator
MDRFGEIGVFVRVVEARSFTRAGRQLGLSASGVSRVISRLEARLGVRLLDRTTHSIGLTTDGAAYFERCSKILHELEDANAAIAGVRAGPRGRLRVDMPTVLGRFLVGPEVPRFLEAFPELAMDLSMRDHVIDPVAEGIDVVLRMADLRESEWLHKKVGALRMVVVGSPEYLARRGRPDHPRDLRNHDTLGFLAGPSAVPWGFRSGDEDVTMPVTGRLHTNSIDAIRMAALAGFGLALVFEMHVRAEIARKALEVVLQGHERAARPVYALYSRDKAALPKVRAFLDFVERVLRPWGEDRSRRR